MRACREEAGAYEHASLKRCGKCEGGRNKTNEQNRKSCGGEMERTQPYTNETPQMGGMQPDVSKDVQKDTERHNSKRL